VLDEVETIQRVCSDARDKSLNALRQLIDEVDAGRYPGLYILMTGTPAFFDGPQGIQRLEPLAQRLSVDFQTDARFDNPRAVQIRLPAFDLDRLCLVGRRVRDVFVQHTASANHIAERCDDAYIRELAEAVAGKLGGKVGIAPRIFLKKLVADVLDRIDQFEDFPPRKHYELTLQHTEIGFQLCQAMQHLLATDDPRETWSRRARQQLETVRAEFRWLDADGTVVVADQQGGAEWWTFAGMGANATLAHELAQATHRHIRYDSLSVTFEPPISFNTLEQALAELRTQDVNLLRPIVDERAIEGLKFSACLPHDLALDMLRARLCDPAATSSALHSPLRFVSL
jgi:hypothetical protein